jgi:SAM-dependent methyltransferase
MAGLETVRSGCCTTDQQASCCEPSEKEACCTPAASSAEGPEAWAADSAELREQVRERYAAAAVAFAGSSDAGCGCRANLEEKYGSGVFGPSLYEDERTSEADQHTVAASLGCGVPTAATDLHDSETILDLGSGAGADVLISAQRVRATGKAIGLDMTDEMLELARRNAQEAGLENVEFRKGYIEDIPLPDASVDLVISNCVLNLSGDKPKVLREAARVLRPGGRFAISDVIADEEMDDETRADMRQWTGCIAGALTRREFEGALADAGLENVEIHETHRVHEAAAAAIIRATKPI